MSLSVSETIELKVSVSIEDETEPVLEEMPVVKIIPVEFRDEQVLVVLGFGYGGGEYGGEVYCRGRICLGSWPGRDKPPSEQMKDYEGQSGGENVQCWRPSSTYLEPARQ